jgi:hypothetical protein
MTRLIARHLAAFTLIVAFLAFWGFCGWLENY